MTQNWILFYGKLFSLSNFKENLWYRNMLFDFWWILIIGFMLEASLAYRKKLLLLCFFYAFCIFYHALFVFWWKLRNRSAIIFKTNWFVEETCKQVKRQELNKNYENIIIIFLVLGKSPSVGPSKKLSWNGLNAMI